MFEGDRVRVVETVDAIDPGDQTYTPFQVTAGEEGILIYYAPERNIAQIALVSRDGQCAWIDMDNLAVAPETTT